MKFSYDSAYRKNEDAPGQQQKENQAPDPAIDKTNKKEKNDIPAMDSKEKSPAGDQNKADKEKDKRGPKDTNDSNKK